jgi:hypothetical protein
MRFVKLTSTMGWVYYSFGRSAIEGSVLRFDPTDCETMIFLPSGKELYVKETPEQIMAMLEQTQAPTTLGVMSQVHTMTWPCMKCRENYDGPSRGFVCPKCTEDMAALRSGLESTVSRLSDCHHKEDWDGYRHEKDALTALLDRLSPSKRDAALSEAAGGGE